MRLPCPSARWSPLLSTLLITAALVVLAPPPANAAPGTITVAVSGDLISVRGNGSGQISALGNPNSGNATLTVSSAEGSSFDVSGALCPEEPSNQVCLDDPPGLEQCTPRPTPSGGSIISCRISVYNNVGGRASGPAELEVDMANVDGAVVEARLAGTSIDLLSVSLVGNGLDNSLTVSGANDQAGAAPVSISGLGGDDHLAAADDVEAAVSGGADDDVLRSARPAFALVAGPRISGTYDGGPGNDLFVSQDGRSEVLSLAGGASDHSLTGIENLSAELPDNGDLLTLTGDDGPNVIRLTGEGSSVAILNGGGDDDVLAGLRTSSNLLDGGPGNDVLCSECSETALTPAEAELFGLATHRSGLYCGPQLEAPGTAGNELRGGADDDLLIGGFGGEVMNGGGGFDTVSAQCHATEVTNPDESIDLVGVTLDFRTFPPTTEGLGSPDNLLDVEMFEGSLFSDVFLGSPGPDVVRGSPEVTELPLAYSGFLSIMRDSSDVLVGNGGNDVLQGSPGDDRLVGGDGNDQLAALTGDDLYIVGSGTDSIFEEASNSTAAGEPQGALDAEIDPETGFLLPREWRGDTVSFEDGGTVGAVVLGDLGTGAKLNPGATTVIDTDDSTEVTWTPGRIEILEGTSQADYVRAADHGQQLVGLAGSDILEGGDGDDQLLEGAGSSGLPDLDDPTPASVGLTGGEGDDELIGGPGLDLIKAEPGADTIDCGGNNLDTVDYGSSGAGVNVTVDAGGADDGRAGEGDTVLNCPIVSGTPFTDTLVASPIVPGVGLFGLGGNDTLTGGPSADVLDGGSGQDSIDGRAGADRIDGGTEGDDLIGGPGEDFIRGRAGVDTFTLADNQSDDTDCNVEDFLFSFDRDLDLTTGCAGQQPEPGSGRPSNIGPRSKVDGSGKAAVSIRCTDSAGCDGAIEIQARGGANRLVVVSATSLPGKLARKKYSLAKGRTTVVKLKLKKPARTVLRKKGKLKVKVVVKPQGSGPITRKVTLRPKKR